MRLTVTVDNLFVMTFVPLEYAYFVAVSLSFEDNGNKDSMVQPSLTPGRSQDPTMK